MAIPPDMSMPPVRPHRSGVTDSERGDDALRKVGGFVASVENVATDQAGSWGDHVVESAAAEPPAEEFHSDPHFY